VAAKNGTNQGLILCAAMPFASDGTRKKNLFVHIKWVLGKIERNWLQPGNKFNCSNARLFAIHQNHTVQRCTGFYQKWKGTVCTGSWHTLCMKSTSACM
jgi:hypothetical protein